MKTLKNEFQNHLNNIVNSINYYLSLENKSNNNLMELYFEIGKNIVNQGETGFVVYLSKFLFELFPMQKGFSPRNLRRMRNFYNTYKNDIIILKKAQKLNWTQNTIIMESCNDTAEREFYIDLAIIENLSKLALIKAIENSLFEKHLDDIKVGKNNKERNAVVCEGKAKWDNYSTKSRKALCEAFVRVCERIKKQLENNIKLAGQNKTPRLLLIKILKDKFFENNFSVTKTQKNESGNIASFCKEKFNWHNYSTKSCKTICKAFVRVCKQIKSDIKFLPSLKELKVNTIFIISRICIYLNFLFSNSNNYFLLRKCY